MNSYEKKNQLQNKYISHVHKLHIWSALDELDKARHSSYYYFRGNFKIDLNFKLDENNTDWKQYF